MQDATLIHPCPNTVAMDRYQLTETGARVHLAVEGSCGGTSFGLHVAADVIGSGQRVLWASTDMPNAERFAQLFAHLSLTESSRFHAMNFGGRFDRAVDAMIEAANALPSVGLIVLDDWCDNTGRIPNTQVEEVKRLGTSVDANITLLLISKGSVDASGNSDEAIRPRASDAMNEAGFEPWTLSRPSDGAQRRLTTGDTSFTVVIEDSGFVL